MPFTEEFIRIKRKYERNYPKELALEFAYKEAFKNNMNTYRKKERKFNIQLTNNPIRIDMGG